jgi:hypothetical protein
LFIHELTARPAFGRTQDAENAETFSFNFLLRGQKVKNMPFETNYRVTLAPEYTHRIFLKQIGLYVCRPLNDKHKTGYLCALGDSAVERLSV